MKRLRVVGGSVGGRRLVSPRSAARPTTDRCKEALFSVLGARATDAVVLDLYAGSGALGIEAMSRGATRAVFVDDDQSATVAIRANLEATGFTDVAHVARASVRSFLARGAPEEPFDLVLLDPPYDTPNGEVTHVLEALAAPGWLAGGAAIVIERAKAMEPPALPPGWTTEFRRSYGDTLLLIASP
ncbi:MAG: 16S rRNA (guanine(966)-N(2))-methyltransferase RsmD [Acidimicrobiia bacterium]